MFILYWIIFGGIAGWIASILTHNNRQMGIIKNVIVGFLGSLVGGFIASEFFSISYKTFSFPGLVISVLGAVLLLVIFTGLDKKR